MSRVLFLMPTNTYRARAFLEAAERLEIESVVATERQQALATFSPHKNLTLDFNEPQAAVIRICEFAQRHPLNSVIAVDDDTSVIAALALECLSLPGNPPPAVRATREKQQMRKLLSAAGQTVPETAVYSLTENVRRVSAGVNFPCVLKPLFLSASRGVIRADDADAFETAWERIRQLLTDPELIDRGKEAAEKILVEWYIPGAEYVLEGLLLDGKLKVLAIFDKPDPLEGPYFAETIYVTPSRATEHHQAAIVTCVEQAVQAIGLAHGPIHAEVRLNQEGAWLLEVAARSIGGLCSRALRFDTDMSLEELILRHALGRPVAEIQREFLASGVMMLPVPETGTLVSVDGIEEAGNVGYIEDVLVTIPVGQEVVALPEGNRYLGFIFARAELPDEVETAIREAYGRLRIDIV